MYILAIETTGPLCSVALLEKNRILAVRSSKEQKNHLKDLMPLIRDMLDDAGEVKRPDYIAASAGPGSFTGIRIGVATARALAQVWKCPAVAVPTLDAFCRKPAAACGDFVACGIINARRGQVYGIVDGFMEGRACMMTDVLDVIEKEVITKGLKVRFFGDGIDAYGDMIRERLGEEDFCFTDESVRYQDAASVGLLAFEKIEKGETVSAEELLPDYMRKAEAQQKLEAGELKIP